MPLLLLYTAAISRTRRLEISGNLFDSYRATNGARSALFFGCTGPEARNSLLFFLARIVAGNKDQERVIQVFWRGRRLGAA